MYIIRKNNSFSKCEGISNFDGIKVKQVAGN